MIKRKFLPENRVGITTDAIAIIANLILFPYLLAKVGNLFDESFADDGSAFLTLAGLLLFTLSARLIGLYLKRYSLQTHLELAGESTNFPIFFVFLNIGVIVLNAAFVVVFLSSVVADLGFVETNYNGHPKDSAPMALFGVVSMLAILSAEVWLIYRLTRPLNEHEKSLRSDGSWLFGWAGEFAADFGLFSYMMVWQIFYNNTAKIFMTPPPNSPDTWEYRIFSAVFLFIVFLIFYVSPRTVFLIEDRKYIGTWVFVFGVYLSSVLRYW
jgi:hypothetical protein